MSANQRQVGGSHYGTPTGRQHWDFVVENDLNYFEGQITKYVVRCRKKNGMQDLQKALHFLEKYIEVYSQVDRLGPLKTGSMISGGNVLVDKVHKEIQAAKQGEQWQAAEQANPNYTSDAFFLAEGGYGSGMNLYTCRKCHAQVQATSLYDAGVRHGCGVALTPGAV